MLCQLLLNMLCVPALVGRITIASGGLMDQASIDTGSIKAEIIFRGDDLRKLATPPDAICHKGVCASATERCADRDGRTSCDVDVLTDRARSPAILNIAGPDIAAVHAFEDKLGIAGPDGLSLGVSLGMLLGRKS
jgi:hypothetical protein